MMKYFKTVLGVLYLGDVVEVLKRLPSECVDLVIADPPYNSKLEWDRKNDEWQFLWLEEVKRVMKEGASLYVFFAPFLGSGTTAVACERLKRKWIGIEIEKKFCELARKRLEEELRVRKLF